MTNQEAIEVIKNGVYDGCDNLNTVDAALDLAIEALEKQVPKKTTGVCPVCERGLRSRIDYCPHCGQALDWRDENE